MNLGMRSNIEQVLGFTQRLHPQMRYATAVALTRTGQVVRRDLRDEMPRVFDRPTRWTLNSLFLKPATKQELQATVWFKDTGQGAANEYLQPEVFGGTRSQKRFEKRLQAAGIMPAGWVAIPARGAKLDAYGNMSAQQIVQILSVLRAQLDPQQNTTERSRGRAKAKGKSRDYFVSGPMVAAKAGNGGRLPFGIYQRVSGRIVSILFFAPAARYSARFDFFRLAERSAVRTFPAEMVRAWRQAVASAH